MKDVCLVQMPYTTLTEPSLALGILKSCLNKNGISCKVFYGDIKFAKYFTYQEYMKINYGRLLHQLGEASFAGFVWDYKDEDWQKKYLDEIVYSVDGYDEEYSNFFEKCNAIIPNYLQQLAEEILSEKPCIVGCSSSFQQNNASLALLKVIKKIAPDVVTVMGGSNCALESGKTLVQEVDWLDYAFSGDGEKNVPEMYRMILENEHPVSPDKLPYGVMSKDTAKRKTVFAVMQELNGIPYPDFDEYFNEIQNLNWINKSQISLPVESSRGCWWHEKKGCTFCGLCITNDKYRQKDSNRFLDEVIYLKNRYNIRSFFLTDSILSNEAVRELPELIEANKEADGLNFFSEVKSNLSGNDLFRLKKAGFYFMQPGIEALQDDLLTVMNKGNRAIKHVELLKNARRYNIRFSWNMLFGFPGEKEEWVRQTVELIPYITHLQPPNWGTHIIYQKYSHYYENREKYGLKLKPLKVYDYIYGFNERLVQGIAYNFYPENAQDLKGYFNLNEQGKIYDELMIKILEWRECYHKRHDCLQMIVFEDRLSIIDLRKNAEQSNVELIGSKKDVYLFCDTVRKQNQIVEYMKQFGLSEQQTLEILKELEKKYLIVSIRGEYLSLAVSIGDHCAKQDEQ